MMGSMEHVRISLSPEHRVFVERQVAVGNYTDVSDYLAALIDADLHGPADDQKLAALLHEGLEGPFTDWTDADAKRLVQLAKTGH